MEIDPQLPAADRPLISVVMPAYKSDPRLLRRAVASVRAQTHPDWELVIVDDGSESASAVRAVRRAAGSDPRISAHFLDSNRGISAASNLALDHCRGELVAFLDHDDELAPDALRRMAMAFSEREIDVAYSDEDKLTPRGEHIDPFFKPDWSPIYALGAMYIGHLLVVRRELIEQVGGFDPGFDKIQDFELLLRLSERTERIHHVPEVLYHWRAVPGSIAAGPAEKAGVEERQEAAVNAHLRRRGIDAGATPHESIPHRLRLRPLRGATRPSVSLIVHSRDSERPDKQVRGLREHTAGPLPELIPVAGDRPARRVNEAAARAAGEYLAFLADDIEIVEPDWLEQLLLFAQLPGVGAVGPAISRPDGLLDAAGMAIGLYDPAAPVLPGAPAEGDGYFGSVACAREVSAIPMQCMVVRRSVFEQLGGFSEAFSRQFCDLDLCMRLGRRGLSTVCTPYPRTVSHRTEAARRRDFDVLDRALFVDRWYAELEGGDPFYGRSFSRYRADYTPAPVWEAWPLTTEAFS